VAGLESEQLVALQWGRDHLVAETGTPRRKSWAPGRASMGPRPSGRGNLRRTACSRTPRGCFNGAATIWSRKPGRPRWMSYERPCFNGAATIWSRKRPPALRWAIRLTTSLQWGRDHLVAETRGGWPTSPGTQLASMGPRPSGRGNPGPCTASRWCWTRFNGAATIWSRKQHRRRPMARSPKASMGPRPSGRGNVSPTTMVPAARSLQWGRDHLVAETAYRVCPGQGLRNGTRRERSVRPTGSPAAGEPRALPKPRITSEFRRSSAGAEEPHHRAARMTLVHSSILKEQQRTENPIPR